MLPFTINVLAFLYLKANSKEIWEEISFPSLYRKILMSAFLLRFKADYLEEKCVATPIQIQCSPCKNLLNISLWS